MSPRIKEAYPGQLAELCEAADRFVVDYWRRCLDQYKQVGKGADLHRWLEEADVTLWHHHGGSRTRSPGVLIEWWQRRVGDQWKTALQLWQEAGPEHDGGGWCCRGGAMSPPRCRTCSIREASEENLHDTR